MIRRIALVAAFVPLVGFATGTWLVEARPAVRFPAALAIAQQIPPATQPQPAAAPQPQAGPGPAREESNLLTQWPEQEVPYIISAEERDSFQKLRTDEEREKFIEMFWLRRDPSPGTAGNEFREEYYRRIVVANQRFTRSVPGWRTDRGRMFIMLGPADEVETHALGGTYVRRDQDGTTRTNTFPFERWRYRSIEGLGNNVILEFVDSTGDGNYRLEYDPADKQFIQRFVAPKPQN